MGNRPVIDVDILRPDLKATWGQSDPSTNTNCSMMHNQSPSSHDRKGQQHVASSCTLHFISYSPSCLEIHSFPLWWLWCSSLSQLIVSLLTYLKCWHTDWNLQQNNTTLFDQIRLNVIFFFSTCLKSPNSGQVFEIYLKYQLCHSHNRSNLRWLYESIIE